MTFLKAKAECPWCGHGQTVSLELTPFLAPRVKPELLTCADDACRKRFIVEGVATIAASTSKIV